MKNTPITRNPWYHGWVGIVQLGPWCQGGVEYLGGWWSITKSQRFKQTSTWKRHILVGGWPTPLKNISQLGWLSHILWKIKNVWNHQPEIHVNPYESTSTHHDFLSFFRLRDARHVPVFSLNSSEPRDPGEQRWTAIKSRVKIGSPEKWMVNTCYPLVF